MNPDESAFGGYEDRLNGIVFRFAGDKRGVEHQLHTGFFAGFQKHIFQNMGRGDAVGGSLCAPCRGNGGGTAGDTAADYDRIKSHFFFDSERCNCIYRNFHLCRFYSD